MEKERYYKKEIVKNNLFPEGLFEIKDRKRKKWYLEIEIKEYADTIVEVLNQQDLRIKELDQMNSRPSQGIYWGNGEQFCDKVKKLKQENQQLKQSQNQKAIEELSNLKATLVNSVSPILLSYNEYVDKVFEMINNQIKELGSEK